jgi:hypothetical protein
MRTVTVSLSRRTDGLSTHMTSMRAWLDEHHCSPSRFHYDLRRDMVLIEVDFATEAEAEAFRRQFAGNDTGSRRLKRPHRRETMEQVCWWRLTAEEIRAEAEMFSSKAARETMAQVALSYDRLAEDLEKRLANPRYRDGLIVA